MPSFESHIKSHSVKLLANKKAEIKKHAHYKGTALLIALYTEEISPPHKEDEIN